MSSRGSYSQKKKREAVRRLSNAQQNRQSVRGRQSAGVLEGGRRRRSAEKRQRGDEEQGPLRQGQRGKRDDGKRFISPLNNPGIAAAPAATSSASAASGGLFSNPSSSLSSEMSTKSSPNLFAQSMSSSSEKQASPVFPSQSSSPFGATSSDLFKQSSASVSANHFQSSGSSVFGAGSGSKTSIFGKALPENSSTGLKITVGSGGTDDAGTGRAIESRDRQDESRLVVSREPPMGEARQGSSGVFGRLSARDSDAQETTASTSLFGKVATFGSGTTSKGSAPFDRGSPRKDSSAPKMFQDPGGSSSRSPLKREVIPERRRQLTSFDDPFESDISDLETFGSAPPVVKKEPKREARVKGEERVERESIQGRAPAKRAGLFGRALEEASGVRGREPPKRRRDDEMSSIEPSRVQKLPTAFASKSDIKSLTTIICKDVPDDLNNRIYLSEFFEKFGRLKRVSVNPRKTMATIYFEEHEPAAKAKKTVKMLAPGTEAVTIFWGQRDKSKERSSSRRDENTPPAPVMQVKAEPVSQQTKRALSPAPVLTVVGYSTRTYNSANERYEALEDRDKQIRKGMTKQSDLATAKKMVGASLDMCPEKERYMRENQRRLSPYEMVPGTEKVEKGENPSVCHHRAVKEYSRSSADQEEPLPSELREPRVLDMTMNYLMAEIMNREPSGVGGDGRSWSDWFDFLWNRTRSIRKEVTQQQLCGTIAVNIMEKCTRFHIYCSYRLCEEDLMTFDPKINNENLTKCLQSLKQFYHDLASEGVFCPNEAEFRAYEVLLNLTGGDILREVQQYRPEVRNSEAVVFALKVSSAFSRNNYCRFFKLIRSAPFMHACMLHRYFLQCRSDALDTMNKAFSTPKGTSSFPTGELVHLLAFEDEDQASYYCESHGLASTEGAIQFSRTGFFYPEEALLPQRAPSVIEAKNNRSVGEVVNGGPLPLMPPHIPLSSFDEEGHLINRTSKTGAVKPVERRPERRPSPVPVQQVEVMQRPLQESVKQPAVSVAPPQQTPPQQTPPQQTPPQQTEEDRSRITNEVIKDVTKELFLEVIDGMVSQLAVWFIDTLKVIQACPLVLDQLVTEEVQHLSRLVATETVEEERYREAARKEEERRLAEERWKREREQSARLSQAAQQLSEDIVEEVVEESLKVIMRQEIRLYQSQIRHEAIQRCSSVVAQEVLEEVTRSEVTSVSREVIAMARAERERQLSDIAAAMSLKQLGNCFQKWRRVQSKRAKIRRALETFPAGPPNQDQAEQLRLLWPNREDTAAREPSLGGTSGVRQALPLCLNTPYDVVTERESLAKHVLHHHYLALVKRQRAWAPLDLPMIHQDNFQQHSHDAFQRTQGDKGRCRYWKVVASLPTQSRDNQTVCDWLKAKLRRGKISDDVRLRRLRDNGNVETLSLYTQRSSSKPIGVCTKAVCGAIGGRHAGYQLLGTSGVILTLNVPSARDLDACIHEAAQRLNAILSHTPSKPSLPLLVCVISNEDLVTADSSIVKRLRLAHCVERGAISSWKIIAMPTDVVNERASEELEEGFAWLSVHHPKPPNTASDPIKEYLDTGLARFFSTNIHQLAKHKKDTGQFPMQPQVIIDLYNSVVSHLGSVVSSPTLGNISWPPSEFATNQHPDLPAVEWNMSDTLQNLWDTIQSLELPQFPALLAEDWSSVCENCIEYAASLPGRDCDKAPLLSRVRWLLGKSRRSFEATCFMTFDTEGCEPSSQHAPWVDILEECVSYMMSSLGQSTEGEHLYIADCPVHYFQAELDDFELPATWLQELNQTMDETVTEQLSLQQSFIEAATRRRSVIEEEEELERERRRSQKEAELAPDNRSFLMPEGGVSLVGGAKKKTTHLRKMLDKEKKESLRFDALLTSLLEDPFVEELAPLMQMEQMESEFRLQLPPLPKASQLSESQLVSSPDTPAIVLEDVDCGNSLPDQIKSLKERLAAEKQAALMAEMRLAALLDL